MTRLYAAAAAAKVNAAHRNAAPSMKPISPGVVSAEPPNKLTRPQGGKIRPYPFYFPMPPSPHSFLSAPLQSAPIPGNERSHALARELSYRAAGDRSAIIRPQPFSLSVGDNYRRILSRRSFSIPTSTPPVVQLNAHTSVTAQPYCIWSGFAKTFPTSIPFQTPPSPPGRSG
ncbi:hypothetical protein HPB49_007103 [Dermacentor silvarum]|uniref:Uncharacterized protein n=1 Tax=Dermacentor silvarum TaxID=543639 RepID=A0ACB8D3K8_DERSI|nr:hypothetical protein HPB49_007103 [Dermacentor silvarum]